MKKIKSVLIALASVVVLALLYSYSPRDYWYDYGDYTPYFMSRTDLEKSVSYQPGPREMVKPGKIYVKGQYIYVNELYKGVHIIDNKNPQYPNQVGFITAPGCVDMAVKGDVMYLDNAVDLVAFDLDTREVTERIRDFFQEPVAPDGKSYNYGYERPKGYILVGWKERTE